MLIILLFGFALIFVHGFSGHLEDDMSAGTMATIQAKFGSVQNAMLSLYRALFILYTFIFTFAVFNILTGVFVEKAVTAAMPDKDERILEEKRKLLADANEFRQLFAQLDMNNSGTISWSEFKMAMKNEKLVTYMSTVGLEVYDVELFFRAVA